MIKLKDTIKKFLVSIFGDTIKDVITRCLFGGGLFFVWKYFQKLIQLLNVQKTLPLGLLLALSLIIFFTAYKLGRPRKSKFKPFFFNYQNLSWRTHVSSNPEETYVEETPYCIKCKVKYVWTEASWVYNRTSILICPGCGDRRENLDTELIHEAVVNLVEAKIRDSANKSSL